MKRLGYDRYVASGGDWGGEIVDVMGVQAPPGLLGIHTNFAGAVRPDVAAGVQSGAAPPGLDDEETRNYEKLKFVFRDGRGLCNRERDPPAGAVRNCGFTRSASPPG